MAEGALEDADGILRQSLPRSADPGNFVQAAPDKIAQGINDCAREILGWRTRMRSMQQYWLVL